MKEIIDSPNLVAFCGLYCGACARYLKDKCPGCQENSKATWCAIRTCCMKNEYSSCADCKEFSNPKDCKKFDNFMSKLFGLIFRSDREACINQIKELGLEGHAAKMTELKHQAIKKL
ncbi:MAG: DUF3795 domain-containing protein [Elusimicrobia bacterium]|nr:DUF3795 domain-containing protein [Elusimicrobiota bacterium]